MWLGNRFEPRETRRAQRKATDFLRVLCAWVVHTLATVLLGALGGWFKPPYRGASDIAFA